MSALTFNPIEEIIEDISAGKMVIVTDDPGRENEADLIAAASMVTPEIIAFMATHGRGLICAPITAQRAEELHLPPMTRRNTESRQTAFTVSVDAAEDITTGISAADRSATVGALIDGDVRPRDLARPGHIFPLRYHEGGVLKRAGHTEAAVDLAGWQCAFLYLGKAFQHFEKLTHFVVGFLILQLPLGVCDNAATAPATYFAMRALQ